MFWTSMGLLIASFIGFLFLRLNNAPDGEESRHEFDVRHKKEVEEFGADEADERDKRLNAVKYVTFLLMAAGVILFVVYCFVKG